MRDIRHCLWVIIAFYSCSQTPQQKAETAIKKYLSKELNDAASYEPVETRLDSFYAEYWHTKEYDSIMAPLRAYDKDLLNGDIDLLDTNKRLKHSKDQSEAMNFIEDRGKKFSPVFYGWNVYHKYRAKNALGALILISDSFLLNKDYQIMKQDSIRL